jgi:LmbE family N-acetylglucosaminyl deacetylase
MIDKSTKSEKYLFLGAHPDDIELGAGGTLAKSLANRIECHTAIFSDFQNLTAAGGNSHDSQVFQESIAAQLLLGMAQEDIHFYSFSVRSFENFRQEILQILIDKFLKNQYTHVFIPNTLDIHQDHKVISNEAIRAFKFCSVLGYELPWNNIESKVNLYNILNESHVTLKLSCLKMFKSQKDRFYFAEEKLTSIIKFRGLQIGAEAAEAFEVIRYVAS